MCSSDASGNVTINVSWIDWLDIFPVALLSEQFSSQEAMCSQVVVSMRRAASGFR